MADPPGDDFSEFWNDSEEMGRQYGPAEGGGEGPKRPNGPAADAQDWGAPDMGVLAPPGSPNAATRGLQRQMGRVDQ